MGPDSCSGCYRVGTIIRLATIGMEILGKLFGSTHIIKILRLFLFNPNANFEQSDIIERTRVPEEIVRVERSMLERIGLIKKRSFFKEVEFIYNLEGGPDPMTLPEWIVRQVKESLDANELAIRLLAGELIPEDIVAEAKMVGEIGVWTFMKKELRKRIDEDRFWDDDDE